MVAGVDASRPTATPWRSKLRRLHCLSRRHASARVKTGEGKRRRSVAAEVQVAKRPVDAKHDRRQRVLSDSVDVLPLQKRHCHTLSSEDSSDIAPTLPSKQTRAAVAEPVAEPRAEHNSAEAKQGDCHSGKRDKASKVRTVATPPKQVREVLALALRAVPKKKKKTPPVPPPAPPPLPPAAQPKLDAREEILRISQAESPLQVLGLKEGSNPSEEETTHAWKRLVLSLHPDKLHRLDASLRNDGAEALHRVHQAKEELRRRAQETCAQVPSTPERQGFRCLDGGQGRRKYEVSWKLQEMQDPSRPIEAYEIWGPRYFSDAGEPFDWVMLAKVPQLQSQFVIVEEAPTQQDVMWAADRVLRPTLPITVHAVNGRGSSEALNFELPWGNMFPWLRGQSSVLCTSCFRLCQCTGPYTKCSSCGAGVSGASKIILRCTDCTGELLWEQASRILKCTCCFRQYGKDIQQWKPGAHSQKPWVPAPGRGTVPPRPQFTSGRSRGNAW